MLLCTLLLGVVWNMKLHELVEATESVTEGGVFNPLFISDDEVVQS